MQLVITVKDGATNKDIAAALRFQANLIAGMEPKAAAARENTDDEPGDDDDDGFTETPPKTGKGTKEKKSQAAASFEEDGGDDTDGAAEEDFTDDPPPKKGKGKKVTIDMVNDACKAKAADSSRKEVLALLKKHFKTQSVSEIKPELYAKVIEVMES